MVDVLAAGVRLLAALFLVALNGFFVASEFALVRIRSTAVDQMVDEGRTGAKTLQDALADLDEYLAATQLGITVASLGLGWIGEPAVATLIEPVLAPVLSAGTLHFVAVLLGFSAVTFLHVVFGELAPKTIAISEAERLALLIAPPMKFFYYLFLPGLVVFNGTANFFTSRIGIEPASETEETLSEEEIRMVLSRSGQEGHVDAEEVSMIERVFELDDITAREVMIPEPHVVSIPEATPLADIRASVVEHEHTRYPVVDNNGDEVLGYLDVKDIVRAEESADAPSLTAGDLIRDIPMVPETTPVGDLLTEFQDQKRQMAAIIDEWGSLEGIATVEDVVEVVVGDLRDDFDEAEMTPEIDRHDNGSYVADGGLAISRLNDVLDADFEKTAYGTLGGLVFDRLGRPPEVGDSVTAGEYRLAVEAVDGARIKTVRITTETAEPAEEK